MSIDLPHFNTAGMLGLQGNQWGWVGAVAREDQKRCEAFLRRVKEGDVEGARECQDIGGRLVFAIAKVSVDKVTVALFERVAEPVGPVLLWDGTFENKGVRLDSTEVHQLETHFQTMRLSWKESFVAILKSLK